VTDSQDALQQVLDDTRARFIATFVAQCAALRGLIDEVATLGPAGPIDTLTQVAHRLKGLAGTIGFPTVSTRAAELESLIDGVGNGTVEALRARVKIDAIEEAFATDQASLPASVPAPIRTLQGGKILVVEDEADQQAMLSAHLAAAGYVPIPVVSGNAVLETARAERPALILLDIALPGLDGYSVCRQLKADPGLGGTPVILMATGATVDDRLAGLSLGADEFLIKPLDLGELLIRITLLLKRALPRDNAPRDAARVRTVVVADDDPDVTRIVDAQFRAAGYRTILAFDGTQTVAAVDAHAPDAIVLDLMMPKLSGFDVLTHIRDSPGPRPRIVVLSARGREADVSRAFELGADDYMTKPFNPQELAARLARLLV
jgi:DNA-binding response OmpR family regulator